MNRELELPIDEVTARGLRVGDALFVTGRLFTARDEAHRTMLAAHERGEPLLFDAATMALFHCGPVVRAAASGWKVIAAGPTTSARMELFEDRFLDAFRPRIVIGKGGMGAKTQAALEKLGAVYVHFPGGAGALAARAIRRVDAVYGLDRLGMTEAVWIFDVRRFGPLLVTMDSRGGNLYRHLRDEIARNVRRIHAGIDGGPAAPAPEDRCAPLH